MTSTSKIDYQSLHKSVNAFLVMKDKNLEITQTVKTPMKPILKQRDISFLDCMLYSTGVF